MKYLKNQINQFLATLLQIIFGWKIKGKIPKNIKKYIIIGAPHTSNWDLFYGILWAYKLKIPIKYVIKIEAMYFPLNLLLKLLGAIPIIRNHNNPHISNTKLIIDIVNKKKEIGLAISPEGTRKNTKIWKTGFYYIAKETNIPIIPVYIDYNNKTIGTFDIYYPTDNMEKDINFLKSLYKNIKGKKYN